MNGEGEEIIEEMRKNNIPRYMWYFGVHLYKFNYQQVKHLRKILEIVEQLWQKKGDKKYETK